MTPYQIKQFAKLHEKTQLPNIYFEPKRKVRLGSIDDSLQGGYKLMDGAKLMLLYFRGKLNLDIKI